MPMNTKAQKKAALKLTFLPQIQIRFVLINETNRKFEISKKNTYNQLNKLMSYRNFGRSQYLYAF